MKNLTHKIWTAKGNAITEITPIIGELSWRSSVEELGQQIDINLANSNGRFFPKNPVDVGNMIILKNQDEIFRGIIVSEKKQGRGPIGYVGFDGAFYLNKSKSFYQFNKLAADKAIRKIVSDFKIPIGSIIKIPTLIDEIFPGEAPSEIIRKILEQAEQDQGKKYRMEMRAGRFYIELQTDLLVKGQFRLAANLGYRDLNSSISGPSRSRSIDEMKNSVHIVSDEKVIAKVEDPTLIAQYGLLQEVVEVQDKDVSQARNAAKNILKDLGRVLEDISLEMMGDDRIRAGRIIEIEEPVTGLKGKYLVNSVTHVVKKGIHTMSLQLGWKNG